jgi:hypothetical protein
VASRLTNPVVRKKPLSNIPPKNRTPTTVVKKANTTQKTKMIVEANAATIPVIAKALTPVLYSPSFLKLAMITSIL